MENDASHPSASTSISGQVKTDTFSTGNIAVPINNLATVDVPISVNVSKVLTKIQVLVRLNHTFDSDLQISIVSPTGKVVPLSIANGGGADNYGSGSNNCSGTFTTFDANAAGSIKDGVAPFAAVFRPEGDLATVVGDPTNGTWKLRVTDTVNGDTGTIGCVQMRLAHPK